MPGRSIGKNSNEEGIIEIFIFRGALGGNKRATDRVRISQKNKQRDHENTYV